jgi:hypothetical protein
MYYGFRLVTTVFALASMIFVSSYAAQGSSAEDTAGGIQPANQVVMVDDTASVEDEATFGASATAVGSESVGENGLVDDIALLSGSRVRHCELGLLIRRSESADVDVALLDAKGRAVLSKHYSSGSGLISVATDALPAGVYVYTVRMADSVYTNSFMVTR